MATHPHDHSGAAKLSLVRDRRHLILYDTVVLDAACQFVMRARLLYVWGILKSYFGAADELFKLRYDELLNRAGA